MLLELCLRAETACKDELIALTSAPFFALADLISGHDDKLHTPFSMKSWSLFLLAFALYLTGCGKKEVPSRDALPSQKSPDTSSSKPTAEQLSSTLRVQVALGGLPPRTYAAALIHRDDVAIKDLLYSNHRLVLTLLKGWTEKQLRDWNAHITVMRNKTDREGNPISVSSPAELLRFNEQSGVALLMYVDDFEYTMEVGFHLDKGANVNVPVSLLRTSSPSGTAPKRSRAFPPFTTDAGVYRPIDGKQGRVELPSIAPDSTTDLVQLAVRPPDKLVGFVEVPESGVGAITTMGSASTGVPVPVVNTLGIAFSPSTGDSIRFGITTEVPSGGLTPKWIQLREVKSPGPDLLKTSLGEANEFYRPIAKDSRSIDKNPEKPGQLLGSLRAPSNEGEECVYLLQLTWSLFSDRGGPSVNGHPFLVKLQKKGGEIYPTVEGIPNLNPVQGVAKAPPKSFALEAKLVDLREIAGGREVLMQLEGPPFWKRFSLTRNEWLPLPPVNLSNVSVTGNLSALFILDKGAAEVRKYNLTDLQLIASTKLPTGKEYVAILGGCNSERAPIHVVSARDVTSLSPDTLQQQDVPASSDRLHTAESKRGPSGTGPLGVTGDGLGVSPGSLVYTDDASGLSGNMFDLGTVGFSGHGVSPAFVVEQGWDQKSWLSTFATPNGETLRIPLPQEAQGRTEIVSLRNSPVILRLTQGAYAEVPARPARVELFSYFDTTPFAEITAAEFDNILNGGDREYREWFSFDPYSLRLGAVSWNRKIWVVHQVNVQENRRQPVLLNWPDTSLSRGGEFNFKPVIFGGTKFGAELIGVTETAAPTVNEESVSFRVAPNELASLFLMKFKVPGPDGKELSYNIPLHVFGPQFPVVLPINAEAKNINHYGAGFKSFADRKQLAITLPITRHLFADPVKQVLGPVAGHIALVSLGQRVDLLSLQTRKIVSSFVSSPKVAYYAGAEALFEYDSASRTLTRISVPDGTRERSMTLPNGLRLHALAVGAQRSSPLTLVLEQIQGQATDQIGNWTVTTTQFDRNVVVLDNRTFQAAGWAQPKLWIRPNSLQGAKPFNFGGMKDFPDHLPSSYSGQFITIPNFFLALGQSVSMAARFPTSGKDYFSLISGPGVPRGSISGMNVADSSGDVFKGGVGDEFRHANPTVLDVSPCGRYRLLSVETGGGAGRAIEVRTVEGNRPLFRVGRMALFQDKFKGYFDTVKDRVAMLSEAGPLMVLAGGGKAMDLIDLDIPRLARETAPTEFHISSQPAPCVMEGATLEYQIQSNNPGAIATCRLRNQLAGATISPTGLLRYTAPRPVAEPTRVEFSLEIVGKEGQTILHEFPLFVLPYPKTNVAPKQENTRRPGI